MNEYVRSDLIRYYGKFNMLTFFLALRSKTFRFQYAFRLCHSKRKISKLIGRCLWKFNRTRRYQLQIPLSTEIGYGLYIAHGGPIIINGTATIGNNCNLSQFTTIGSNHCKAAVIGDNVYIGPNTCIIEDVIIGDNVTIGAGSVVTKDIPDNATVAGNYAKILNYNNPARYIVNRYKID